MISSVTTSPARRMTAPFLPPPRSHSGGAATRSAATLSRCRDGEPYRRARYLMLMALRAHTSASISRDATEAARPSASASVASYAAILHVVTSAGIRVSVPFATSRIIVSPEVSLPYRAVHTPRVCTRTYLRLRVCIRGRDGGRGRGRWREEGEREVTARVSVRGRLVLRSAGAHRARTHTHERGG